jgi:hypothetical protein
VLKVDGHRACLVAFHYGTLTEVLSHGQRVKPGQADVSVQTLVRFADALAKGVRIELVDRVMPRGERR